MNMFQFNLDVDPEIAEELSLDEDTVFETYFEDGKVIVRILDDAVSQEFESTPCDMCPFFCKRKGICIAII